jgi:DNA processing protein
MGYPPAQRLEGATLPPRLRDLPEPPTQLFLHGIAPRGPCVGVVGTREPSKAALRYARALSSWLAMRGVAIVSGGAKGIDAAAHRGALDGSGATLVVAASSFDRPFPEEHRPLFERVLKRGGGYLSSFELGVEARRHQFLDRNALLVALCHALIVVEAPLRSGARNAAKWARLLGRPCFVVPSPPWNERGRGCIAELQLGARPLGAPQEVMQLLAQQALHVLASEQGLAGGSAPKAHRASSEIGAPGPAARSARRTRSRPFSPVAADAELDALPAAVLRAIRAGAEHPDQIAERAGLSAPEVNHALLRLTLGGHIVRSPLGDITVAH